MRTSSVKTYDTVIKILGQVESLKPGMTAIVNIHVDQVPDVLAVPVHAVVQVDREIWCYIEAAGGVERRDVVIGRSNEKFVHIREGLSLGDRVVLNPMDIFDEQQQQNVNEISPESGVPEMPESLAAAAAEEAATQAATTIARTRLRSWTARQPRLSVLDWTWNLPEISPLG